MAKFKKKFLDQLLKVFPLDFERFSPEDRQEMNEVSRNALLDLDGPRSISRTPPAKELWYHRRLFLPCAAIYKSHDTLLDVEVYVRRFPYRGTRVSPTTHLRHSIELYLQEAYILRQRMIDFLNALEKDYTGTPQGEQLARVNQPLCRMLKDCLRPIMEARKEHVHGSGYDDDKLKRIDGLELLARYAWPKDSEREMKLKSKVGLLYKLSYKQERQSWATFVRNWNSGIEKLQEGYFEILGSIIFGEKGDLVFPPASETFSD